MRVYNWGNKSSENMMLIENERASKKLKAWYINHEKKKKENACQLSGIFVTRNNPAVLLFLVKISFSKPVGDARFPLLLWDLVSVF